MVTTIIGLDLAATLNKAKIGLAVVEKKKNLYFLTEIKILKTTYEILSHVERFKKPILLAIDGPLKLPLQNDSSETEISDAEHEWDKVYTYRPYEDLIFNKNRKFKVSGRTFSSLAITYRAQILRGVLEKRGWELIASPNKIAETDKNYFIEVFPNLTLSAMGITLGKKKERYIQKLDFVKGLFDNDIHEISLKKVNDLEIKTNVEEDILDAIICAWTGALFLSERSVCLGDEKYGFVICPLTELIEEFIALYTWERPYSYEIFNIKNSKG